MEPRKHEQQLGLQRGGLVEKAGPPSIVCALQVALHPRWSLKAHLKHWSVNSEVETLAMLLDAQKMNCAGNSSPVQELKRRLLLLPEKQTCLWQ